ncbi:hypothetical protein IAR55_001875 [Kwoniella newhampshirensis]|uniref:Uncharacterized protein n=1 Tax=Kwoniella newhampshirensis TaxID=1651941 RepID=A0AAW0Z3E0_9TREE
MRAQMPILLSLVGLLSVLGAQAQDKSKWPEWVTNDYDCVIGCLSGFNDTITSVPRPDLEQQAFGCSSGCKGEGMGNYYQTLYYIQLFYATGSIYEWAASAPDGYKHATFSSNADPSASHSASAAESAWSSADASPTPGGVAAIVTDGGPIASPSDGGSNSTPATDGVADSDASNGPGIGPLGMAAPTAAGGKGNATFHNGEKSSNHTAGGNKTGSAAKNAVMGLGGMNLGGLMGGVFGLLMTTLGGACMSM